MTNITDDALHQVDRLLVRYDDHPTTSSGSWKVRDRESWYRDCWSVYDLLAGSPPVPPANADLHDALVEDRNEPKERRGSQENIEKIHDALLRIKQSLKSSASCGKCGPKVSEYDSNENLDDYLHRPQQPKPFDFLCVDLRQRKPEEALKAIDELKEHEIGSSDGFLPPVVVVGRPEKMAAEQIRALTERGAYFIELPKGFRKNSDLPEWVRNELEKRGEIARAPSPSSAVGASGAQAGKTADLNPYLHWPERLGPRDLRELFEQSAKPDSATKDD